MILQYSLVSAVLFTLNPETAKPLHARARDKTLLYCPTPAPYHFLKEGHRYLFKRSSPRYPEQYWVEILAYRIGAQMAIPVPPAFVAYDSRQNQSGALIEWFLDPVPMLGDESYIPGGDYCQQYIPGHE